MAVPEGYNHKATSQSFSGAETVVIYYSIVEDNYLVQIETPGVIKSLLPMTKAQLELVVHAGTDVLEMAAR
jgi:hypothetical protein